MAVDASGELRRLMDGWAAAVRARDVDGSLSHYADDVVAFDLVEPLQYVGLAALRGRLEEWLSSFDGPIEFENRDVEIVEGDRLAFAHGLNHVKGTTRDGQVLDMYWRATLSFRKLDGDWTVTHTHTSVPFDMQTGEASLELGP